MFIRKTDALHEVPDKDSGGVAVHLTADRTRLFLCGKLVITKRENLALCEAAVLLSAGENYKRENLACLEGRVKGNASRGMRSLTQIVNTCG